MSKPHILIFPYPAQGHLLPLLDLTHQLALKSFTITIIITPKNLPTLHPLLSSHPNTIHTLILPFPSHPSIPHGIENVQQLGQTGNTAVIAALSKLHDPIIQWLKSHPSPPVAIISDYLLGWTLRISHHVGIPRIVFYSSGALFTSVNDICWKNSEDFRDKRVVEFPDVPGEPMFKREHLSAMFLAYKECDPDYEIVKEGYFSNMESWGYVFNSFHGLEGPYLEYLRMKSGHRRVFTVGPLSLQGPRNVTGRGDTYNEVGYDVNSWLDGCPDGSVLYVCFGSQKLFNREQIEALASGLERSDTRFVWVVKPGTAQQMEEGYGVIPDGFEGRVSGRGFVIKGWAPQVAILSHRAVGGFLSHFGWNSVLEAIVVGVMILGWPMGADQFINAKLLVDDKAIAVRVCEGANTVPDPDELGRVIRTSIGVKNPEKESALKLRDEAQGSVSGNGRSLQEFNELVELLTELDVIRSKFD